MKKRNSIWIICYLIDDRVQINEKGGIFNLALALPCSSLLPEALKRMRGKLYASYKGSNIEKFSTLMQLT